MQEGNGELKIPPRQPPGRLSSSLPREEFMKLRKRRPFCRFPPAKDKSVELWKSLDAAAEIFALASSVLRVELRARRQTLSSESWEAHVPSARAPRRIARSKGIEDKDDCSLFMEPYNNVRYPSSSQNCYVPTERVFFRLKNPLGVLIQRRI